jgi:hypothetical protein
MPPRYAYWTIIVDNQPTAFRSGAKEDLLPTFNRLKAKNDTAVMMWFQNGKLWPTRVDAQEAMIGRGEMGRRGDVRQAGFRDRDRKPTRARVERSAWTPRGEPSTPAPARNADDKLDWKPKGEFVPAPKRADRPERSDRPDWKSKSSAKPDWKSKSSEKPEWKPKGSFDRESKSEWKPKGSFDRETKSDWKPKPRGDRPDWKSKSSAKPEWKPKGSFDRESKPRYDRDSKPRSFSRPSFKPSGDDTRTAKPEWKPKGSFDRKTEWKPKSSYGAKPAGRQEWARKSERPSPSFKPRSEKLDWKPKGEGSSGSQLPDPGSAEKRKWVPKADYKKSMGIEAKKDKNWRPGGEHKDPKQKYKDAKKAKWTKFKKAIRTRSEGKRKKDE